MKVETEEPRIYDIGKEYVIREITKWLRLRSYECLVEVLKILEKELPD